MMGPSKDYSLHNRAAQRPLSSQPETRNRIIKESIEHAKSKNPRPRQKYKAPSFPGTAAFDLKDNFRKLECYGQKGTFDTSLVNDPVYYDSPASEVIEEAATWNSDEHFNHVMQELDAIEEASRSNSPGDLSLLSSDPQIDPSSSSSVEEQDCACDKSWPHDLSLTEKCSFCRPSHPDIAEQSTAAPANATQNTTNYGEPNISFGLSTSRSNGPSPLASSLSTLPSVPAEIKFLRQPPTRPISEQQLINEVKGIYAGLVMVEKKCVELVTQQSQSNRRLENEHCKALVALHHTLLQEHHDFFSASQHPTASDALKRLAIKYAMPSRMWTFGIRNALQLLRPDSVRFQRSMSSYVDLARAMINSLQSNYPEHAHEWELVKYNLREYFVALSADGVDLPLPLIDDWKSTCSTSTRHTREQYPPMTGSFFGDEELPEWYVQTYLQKPRLPPENHINVQGSEVFGLTDMSCRLMSGWLTYGRKIATSFHAFTHTFLFLGLLGAVTATPY